MRFTLKDLLILSAVASVAASALVYAGPVWVWLCLSGVALFALTRLIHAFVLRGRQQAAAIGFFAVCLLYAAMVVVVEDPTDRRDWPVWYGKRLASRYSSYRPDEWSNRLPTALVLQPVHAWLQEQRSYHIDVNGNRIGPAELTQADLSRFGGTVISGAGAQAGMHLTPPASGFVLIAHSLWALLFGYLGGKYAVWVYERSQKAETA